MVKSKFKKSDYPTAKKGDPITRKKTIRQLKINGKTRWVLTWKSPQGKLQRQLMKDYRMSSQIPLKEARKFHRKRKIKSQDVDEGKQALKEFEYPTKAWKNRPNRYDVKGIDSKKGRSKKRKIICSRMNCNKTAVVYRKMDENERPLCKKHYQKLSIGEKRHYFKI